MGRTHALSGMVAYAGIAPLVGHVSTVQLATGIVTTAGAALLPDLDHPQASATHTFGPVTRVLSWMIRLLSGGHRHGTHSLVGIAAFVALAWAATGSPWATGVVLWLLMALAVRVFRSRDPVGERVVVAITAAGAATWLVLAHGLNPWFLPISVGLGAAIHILGDMCTEEGAPLAWPLTLKHVRIGSIDTGHAVEHLIVVPLLLVGLGLLVWHDTGDFWLALAA